MIIGYERRSDIEFGQKFGFRLHHMSERSCRGWPLRRVWCGRTMHVLFQVVDELKMTKYEEGHVATSNAHITYVIAHCSPSSHGRYWEILSY